MAAAAAAVALPPFIHNDAPTQGLVDELRRLEGERAHLQAAHTRRASDDTAVMLQYYGMELDEVGAIIRDRLWALTLGQGEDPDDARVQGFFTALTAQYQGQVRVETEATEPDGPTNEWDDADIATLAALELESDDQRFINGHTAQLPMPGSPVAAPAPLLEPPAVLLPPIPFATVVTNTPLEV